MAIFPEKAPVATGAKTPDLAKIGQNPEKGLKIPVPGVPGIPGEGLM